MAVELGVAMKVAEVKVEVAIQDAAKEGAGKRVGWEVKVRLLS